MNVVFGLFLLPRAPRLAAAPVSPAGSTDAEPTPPAPDEASRGAAGQPLERPAGQRLRPILFAIFATTFAFAGMETTFAYLGSARFDLGPAGLGIAFAAVGVVLILVQGGLVGVVADRYGDRPVAVAGAVLLAMSLMLLPWAPAVLTFIALGLVAAGQALLSTTTAALIARVAHGGRAKLGGALGIGQSSAAAARVLGPLIGGAAYDIAAAPALPAGRGPVCRRRGPARRRPRQRPHRPTAADPTRRRAAASWTEGAGSAATKREW